MRSACWPARTDLGRIAFDDFQTAYTIGTVSLAIVLFDGGLRTGLTTLRAASWPALSLATVGVAITAGVTGTAAAFLYGLTWVEGLLVGSIVASTDAAAVFFLLHLRGTNLVNRVRATLEAESGLNDPMAIFLTITCVELLKSGRTEMSWTVAGDFALVFLAQIIGGAVAGFAGGYILVALINRLKLASGLYPILTLAGALALFAGAQLLGASGFLAVYICGLVIANNRHRARQIIERFLDGLAWLSQIVMFVMLGLLVTPSTLLVGLVPAVLVALALTLAARPLAVMLCVAPFRFHWREHAFLSWVGLRGAVPIFLGTIPVLADVPFARLYFDIAFVVVLASLLGPGLDGQSRRAAAQPGAAAGRRARRSASTSSCPRMSAVTWRSSRCRTAAPRPGSSRPISQRTRRRRSSPSCATARCSTRPRCGG